MSINLIPEDALPKSFFLEPELRRERDRLERKPNGRGDGKSHLVGDAGRDGRSVQDDHKSRAALAEP